MSSRHYEWAMRLTTVKGTVRHVLLQLAYLADRNNGFVTRSHQQLADETGYSVRTIQDALKELVGVALIERRRRTSKRGRLADTFKVLAVLPAKSAARRRTLPAKSAERPGKNCRAYTGEESNHHHLAENATAERCRTASDATTSGDAGRPPGSDADPIQLTSVSEASRKPAAAASQDSRPDTNDERALRLASLSGAPALGECQRLLSALDEDYGRPLVDRAMRELQRQDGVKKPAGLLRAICKRLSEEARPARSMWSNASHGISRF